MMSLDKSEDGNDFDEEFNLSSKWLGEVSSRIKDFDDNRVKLDSVVENIREKLGQMRRDTRATFFRHGKNCTAFTSSMFGLIGFIFNHTHAESIAGNEHNKSRKINKQAQFLFFQQCNNQS